MTHGDLVLASELPEPASNENFQPRVRPWLVTCFGRTSHLPLMIAIPGSSKRR
jgi:hypothetical protein